MPFGTSGAVVERLAVSETETWGVGTGGLYRLVKSAWVRELALAGLTSLWASRAHVFVVGPRHPMVGTLEGGVWRFADLENLDAQRRVTGFGEEAWFFGGTVHRWARGALTGFEVDGFSVTDLVVRGPRDVWALGRGEPTATLLHWNGKGWAVVARPSNLTPVRLVGGPTPWLLEENELGEPSLSVFDGAQWADSKLGEFGQLQGPSLWAPGPTEAVLVGWSRDRERVRFVWNGKYWSSAQDPVQATFVGGGREPLFLRACGAQGPPPEPPSPPERLDSRGPNHIMEVVFANKAALTACALEARRREPQLSGKLVLRWTVARTGQVTKVDVVTEEFKSAWFMQCVVAEVKKWRFPPHRTQGEPIQFPFKF